MITGDNPLTACHVASVLHFTRRNTPTLLFDEPADPNDEWSWRSVDQQITVKLTTNPRMLKESIKNVVSKYSLCITGAVDTHEYPNKTTFRATTTLSITTVCCWTKSLLILVSLPGCLQNRRYSNFISLLREASRSR